MGTVIRADEILKKPASVNIRESLSIFEVFLSETAQKFKYVKMCLDLYNKVTYGVKMISGGVDTFEISRIIGTNINCISFMESRRADFHILSQKDESGNKYDVHLILEEAGNGLSISCAITKETAEHNLYFYDESSASWEPISWEEYCGYTYRQRELIHQETVEAEILRRVHDKHAVTDDELDALLEKNRPLIEIYEKTKCCDFAYCPTEERLLLVPAGALCYGPAIFFEDEKFHLAQYAPSEICGYSGDEYETDDTACDYFLPVREMSKKEIKRIIKEFYTENPDKSAMMFAIPLCTGNVYECNDIRTPVSDNKSLSKEEEASIMAYMDHVRG